MALPPGIAIGNATRLDEVKALLTRCRLPTDDIRDDAVFVVARVGAELCGTAGLEVFGAVALLRSVAVDHAWRHRRIAHALCAEILRRARGIGVSRLYLLTTDAQDFFGAVGFAPLARESVPAEVRATAQFRELCPQSATAMVMELR
jgi:amino-acid N-acetyltransferase